MKKTFISALLILCLASPCHAGPEIFMGAGVAASNNYCAGTCTGSADADVACDTFASTPLCTWNEGGNISQLVFTPGEANPSGMGCTETDTKSLRVVKTGGDNGFRWYVHTPASAKTSLNAQFYLYLSALAFDDGEYSNLFIFNGEYGGEAAIRVALTRLGADYKLKFLYYTTDATAEYITSSTVSAGNWYPIRVSWTSGSNASFWVDWDNNGSYTEEVNDSTNIGTRSTYSVMVGSGTNCYWSTFTYYFSSIKIDDDTMPSACTR